MIPSRELRSFPENFIQARTPWQRIVCGVKESILANDLAENPQDRSAITTGENFLGYFVIKNQRSDAVALLEDAPSRQGSGFCGNDGFHGNAAAEEHVHALIDNEESGTIAFFGVHADEGLAHSGGDMPIDYANIVAEDVVAKFFEVEATTS